MAELIAAQDGGLIELEGGGYWALESDDGIPATGTVTLRQDHPVNHYYDIGDVPVFTATFVDLAGVRVDPASASFAFRTPSGVETSYDFPTDGEVSTSSTGVYVLIAPELATFGVHWCRVVGTDPYAAAERPIGVRSRKTTS